MNAYSLLLEFDSNSPEFCRGVEVGRIWEMLKNSEGFEQTVHSDNVEMIMRMQEATGRKMKIDDSTDSNYCYLTVEEDILV